MGLQNGGMITLASREPAASAVSKAPINHAQQTYSIHLQTNSCKALPFIAVL